MSQFHDHGSPKREKLNPFEICFFSSGEGGRIQMQLAKFLFYCPSLMTVLTIKGYTIYHDDMMTAPGFLQFLWVEKLVNKAINFFLMIFSASLSPLIHIKGRDIKENGRTIFSGNNMPSFDGSILKCSSIM